MRRLMILGGALLALAAPLSTAAVAKTSSADKREARSECRAERGSTDATREAFKAKYGSFGRCVSKKAREAKGERTAARRNAARECRAERAEDAAAFGEQYGRNGNKRNAFGKCVSQKAKAARAEQDEQDAEEAAEAKNAAQECDAERGADPEKFDDTYGRNDNDRNAFGKCVSQKAHDLHDDA